MRNDRRKVHLAFNEVFRQGFVVSGRDIKYLFGGGIFRNSCIGKDDEEWSLENQTRIGNQYQSQLQKGTNNPSCVKQPNQN